MKNQDQNITIGKIETIDHAALEDYKSIAMTFEANRIYTVISNKEQIKLIEKALPTPYTKDYDATEEVHGWLRFDLTNWAMFKAYIKDKHVGGALVAFDTPGVDMLENRSDLAVLWDIRITPEARGQKVGTALLHHVLHWAKTQGCTELKVETQNNNAAACDFYSKAGFRLAQANPQAYAAFPDETQLIWRLKLK